MCPLPPRCVFLAEKHAEVKQIALSLCAALRLRCLSVLGSDGPFHNLSRLPQPLLRRHVAHTPHTTLACSNTERCAADSVVMMECKGLGNSLAPGGISSLPNEMGMASVGPSRISAGRHVALERPCLHSTTYSLDIRAHTHARYIHINIAVHTDCMRVSVFEWLPGLRWCVCAHQDRNTCLCVWFDG